jgi:hypothetical protein
MTDDPGNKNPLEDETLDDSDRPLGDTNEAHDEISPHDLPVDHPGRKAAEEAAGSEDGTTRGNQ